MKRKHEWVIPGGRKSVDQDIRLETSGNNLLCRELDIVQCYGNMKSKARSGEV